ncbi:long-chain fatty acid--CoA ligase, partial [Pseudomonas sp. BGM005]|nr:long-chain fatty acid--CoA ligase [Pseudomonas sp. BG5]
EIAAAIVLREGAQLDVGALRDFCRTRLTPYKVPKRITVVDELPRSLIGKVLRRQVRDRMLAD